MSSSRALLPPLLCAFVAMACAQPEAPEPPPQLKAEVKWEPPFLASPTPASEAHAPPAGEPMRVGGDVSEPVELFREGIHLKDLPKQYILGVCIVEAVIDTNGTVTQVHVLRPNPVRHECKGWVNEVVRAVSANRYRPALYHGNPVPVYITYTILHFPC